MGIIAGWSTEALEEGYLIGEGRLNGDRAYLILNASKLRLKVPPGV